MKKITLSAVILLLLFSASAQQWGTSGNNIYNLNSGNVGIRTSTPMHPLQIWDGGTNPYSGISFIPGTNPNENSIIRTLKSGTYGLTLRAENQDAGKGQAGIVMTTSDGISIPSKVTVIGQNIEFRSGTFYSDDINNSTVGNSALFIGSDQRVGIGTTAPGTFKLAVEGKIGAREVKVTLQTPWPDYVFNQNYQRLSLASLDSFITKNKHLPNIPSAEEVKENGGIDLGEMNAKLLEKIEELTLYVIELKKEIDQIKKTENNADKR